MTAALKAKLRNARDRACHAFVKVATLASRRTPRPRAKSSERRAGDKHESHRPLSRGSLLDTSASTSGEEAGSSSRPHSLQATEAKKPCIAFLPDGELEEKLRQAIFENHRVNDAEERADLEINQLDNQLESLASRIEDMEERIRALEAAHTGEAEIDTHGLQQKLEKLRGKRTRIEARQKGCNIRLEAAYREQRYNMHLLLTGLEEVLQEKGRLPAESTMSNDSCDVTSESQRSVDVDASSASDTTSETSTYNVAARRPSKGLSGELRRQRSCSDLRASHATGEGRANADQVRLETKVQELLYDYRAACNQLRVAQDQLDNRTERFDWENEERDQKLKAGEEVESSVAFDMRQLQETRGMTRNIAHAEEVLAAAKAAVIAAGIQLPGSDVESGFVDDVGDGYRISAEEAYLATLNPARVQAWLEDVPLEDEDDMDEPEIDHWDVESVGISESGSMVADGSARRRIDIWCEACKAARDKLELPTMATSTGE